MNEQGYGICTIGENGSGELDRAVWSEGTLGEIEGTLTVFVYGLALKDAQLALSAEVAPNSVLGQTACLMPLTLAAIAGPGLPCAPCRSLMPLHSLLQAVDDLANSLQLAPILAAFFRTVGIAADTESFYLSRCLVAS